jgi:HAD superfamily hydrolase (TIGR01549 family)
LTLVDNNIDYRHITTVIFDMDGTLIEHTWQLDQVCETLFARFAGQLQPVSQAEFFDCFWSKSEDMWHMVVDGVLDGDVAAKYAYANTLRTLGQDTTLAEPMLTYWMELVLAEATPFDDAYTVLQTVRQKYVTGILTNGFINLQRQKIERYRLADYVDFTLVSEEIGYHKPDKRAFLEALKLANRAEPHQALYIGDNLVADIEGALATGLTPIFINGSTDLEPPAGVLKIRRLSELLPVLGL